MDRFATVVLRHKLLVSLAWLAVLISGVLGIGSAVDRLDASFTLPDADGYETNVDIDDTFGSGGGSYPVVPVVTLPDGRTADSPEVRDGLTQANQTLAQQGLRAIEYTGTDDESLVFGTVYKADIPMAAENAGQLRADAAEQVETAYRDAMPTGSEVRLTGLDLPSSEGTSEESGTQTALTETIAGAIGALIVLAFVFGSLLAFLPLLVAAVSILSGFLTVLGVTYIVDVADLVQYMLAFVGLGVAIDYALLFVTRWREERQKGYDNERAVHRTMLTAGKTVLISGSTVAAGMVVLIALPSPALRSLALGVLLVPLFSVLVTLTMLPVLLATVGPRVDWPRIRTERTTGKLWARWAGGVVRHKWAALLASLALLVPLGITAFSLQLGDLSSSSELREGEPAAAISQLREAGVPTGALTPIEVLVPVEDQPERLASRLGELDGIHTATASTSPTWTADGLTVLNVLPVDETSTAEGMATVTEVRELVAEDFPTARVGGSGAVLLDEIEAEYGGFAGMLVLICVVAFVLLARAYRSLVLALKAVLLNLLSLGAAYGILVLVWQEGYGSELFWGIPALGSVSSLVPLLTFAFLFGLSMDYEVFLLSRMREEYDATGSTRTAIVTGLGRVGRLVTAAALILFLAFASLAGLPETHAKVMATGLGAGILIDATVLRMVLLPAFMAIAGRWNWWLPTWAARVLRVRPESPTPDRLQLVGQGRGDGGRS